ncbi:hypothetical protein NDU88_005242 [Pleurodeles waltl]|uniref:Uncharacterized protein n=1 Tax=Pleurodeles waltl TaxID=8319 RepID=A0AAV7PHH4_PLEWA|nr:hypothetical protein NDU88_005242 [Pleurodeles waltl]
MEEAEAKEREGGLALPDLQYYAWATFIKNMRGVLGESTICDLGQILNVMMEFEKVTEVGFLYTFGDAKFFRKVRFKLMQDLAKMWYAVRRATNLPYYSKYPPLWDSLGSSEWIKDALAIPKNEAGLLHWGQLSKEEGLISYEDLYGDTVGNLSKFKYMQMKSWVKEVKGGVGGSIEVERLLQQPNLDKKYRDGTGHSLK